MFLFHISNFTIIIFLLNLSFCVLFYFELFSLLSVSTTPACRHLRLSRDILSKKLCGSCAASHNAACLLRARKMARYCSLVEVLLIRMKIFGKKVDMEATDGTGENYLGQSFLTDGLP